MTKTTAAAIIANRLGNRTGLDTQILAEMELAQVKLEHRPYLPWFLVKWASPVLTVTVGSREVTLPTDFLRENDDARVWLLKTDGTRIRLEKESYDQLRGNGFFEEQAEPTHYTLLGSTLYLFPEPIEAAQIEISYFAKAALISAGTENSWLLEAPMILIGQTGMQIARFLRDPDAIQLFEGDYQEALSDLQKFDTAREQAGHDSYKGGYVA